MDTKNWWASKTIWANLLAVIAAIGTAFGLNLDAGIQAEVVTVIMGVVNIALRFVTRQPVA